ncbi:MAG: hypothetical protein J5928_05690 [Firmicutes bacterium]|nr:hypothetical protein [Bacillota bacterium]
MIDKRGSFTVYASIIAAAMCILIFALISSAQKMYVDGIVPALGRLHASSILGEYDKELYDRYGILAFYGTDASVSSKLEVLHGYTFDDKPYIDCEVDYVDLYKYSLADQNVLMDQIRLCGVENLATSVLGSREKFIGFVDETLVESGRKIKSDRVIRFLPSYGRTESGIIASITGIFNSVGSPKDLIKSGTDAFLINKYISAKFGDRRNLPDSNKSYLLFEREYIVSGKYSDAENLKAIKWKIIAMREIANMAFLESDKKMRAEATVIGELLTLGYAGEAGAQAVMATWAYLESLNDYELLINGKKVSGIKDHLSWAVDKESILNGWNGDYIDMKTPDGDTYSDYLDLMTYMTGQDTKLLRIMDLIQLNLRYYYRSDFLISEHYTGLDYGLLVNGKTYSFSDSYGGR